MSQLMDPEIERRALHISLLLMDCDGVLTDGRILQLDSGEELKSFHTRDGHGLVMLRQGDVRTGIISGRTSNAVVRRAGDLGINFLFQGVHDKVAVFENLLVSEDLKPSEVAYVGDDIPDIPIMMRVGFAIAVSDAAPETRQAAHYVTTLPGGFGAIREVCELILRARGNWQHLMKPYTG